MKRKLLSLLVLLMTAATGAWADITWPKEGEDGTETKPYTISSEADWNEFCASFDTKDYDGQYVKLMNNIPTADEVNAGTTYVTQMAAETYNGKYFKGTFLGGDHTITVNLGSDWEKYTCGLFRYLDGATIKNLKVDGTVHAKGWKWRGGFAGVTYGNCTFENCTSKVTIDAGKYMYNHSSGGFVGYALGNITFKNCVFWGKLLGSSATNWGGFVGQKDNNDYKVTLTKCLFYPTQVTASATGSATFVRTDDADGVTIGSGDDGAYCTQFLGTQQGTLASTTAPTAGNGIYKNTSVNGQSCYVVATVSGIEDEYTADGNSHTLTPVLTCMGTTLTEGTDYTIADGSQLTYTGAGNYSVTFNAAGSTYTGSCTVSYHVANPSGSCGTDVTWTLTSDGVLTISGTGAMANYQSLSEIPWYSNRNVITSVVIEEGVTTIGNGAFYQCNNLASVSVPATVTSIGEEAFAESGSSSGMAVTIADGSALEAIGAKAFLWSKLTTITLPVGLTTIGKMAFNGCGNLGEITLNSNPFIGTDAFSYIRSDAEVTMNLTANSAGGAKWTTFYNKNYSFEADANTQVFKAALSGSTLTLTELTTDNIVNKDKAVILKSTASPIVMTLPISDGSNDFTGNQLQGVSAPEGVTAADPSTTYVLNYKAATGVGFYKLASGKKLGVGKAYLTYSEPQANEFFGFDETTGINATLNDNVEMTNDNVYDLQGRRVSQPTKGLYIVNGKMVVIK